MRQERKFKFLFLKKFFSKTCFGFLSGLLAGLGAALFLHLLAIATDFRHQHAKIIWFLPMAGFLIGWCFNRFGKKIAKGTHLIIEEIHDPKNIIPLHMAPFILIGTVWTHLFGGSAGREGTSVQIGVSLSDQICRFFHLRSFARKAVLVAGMGAGFGSSMGAPWAGALFGIEVLYKGKSSQLKLFSWWECVVASWTGYGVTRWLKVPHAVYPVLSFPLIHLHDWFFVGLSGILFGFSVRIFLLTVRWIEKWSQNLIIYPPLRTAAGGFFILLLFSLGGMDRYLGLGLPFIRESFDAAGNFDIPLMKLIFTGITLGTGFKGGEFVPLVYIGSTLGSALGGIFPVSYSLLAAVGFVAVFAGAASTPITCTILAMEMFGYQVGIYALIACFTSNYFSGKARIYQSQPLSHKKAHL